MNLNRTFADSMTAAALADLAKAAPKLARGARWPTIQAAPADYREALDGLATDLGRIAGTERLTADAKLTDSQARAATWLTEAEAIVAGVETRATEWHDQLAAVTQPEPPTTDPALLEAMLANARTDARMVLDPATGTDLADRLGELARGDDPAIRHLLLATTWPSTYFRARGDTTAPHVWDTVRRSVLAEVLTGARLDALDQLEALAHVRRAAYQLRAGHTFTVRDNPQLFPEARA